MAYEQEMETKDYSFVIRDIKIKQTEVIKRDSIRQHKVKSISLFVSQIFDRLLKVKRLRVK